MLELLNKYFKEAIIIMASDIKKMRLVMNENIRYLCIYWESETLGLKMSIFKIKNPLDRLKRNRDKRVSNFENILIECI